ncbi:hypothetical protein CYLTODRAFT_385849 [Cylindrobasidium torrendii FP15055 ss-10]|uniref:Peroxisomal membrane protein PEX14 n=1 Tax=Cylindrobasidium torrendii FP15055 ss-10 TaxID=1314674 RepID=A0A0D7BTW0_9AGAR|nr:hypothetical protein CYLTODRAFT_385849 [Cylindrobasidium torrendii FP15055 ss-10]
MADDDNTPSQAPPAAPIPTNAAPLEGTALSQHRPQLIERARAFLMSPAVQQQDMTAKRQFLLDKGLSESEIANIFRDLPTQMPLIPPRTYPLPPPSNLPTMLLGVLRIFSWATGATALLVFVYYRYLLPRITQTSEARHNLRTQHLSLMRRLTTSLAALKEAQSENYTPLPKPDKFREPDYFAACHSLKALLKEAEQHKVEMQDIDPMTVLRCALEEFAVGKQGEDAKVSTEDLFRLMESHITWLLSEDGIQYEHRLWETLTTYSIFERDEVKSGAPETPAVMRWRYVAPTPRGPSPLVVSLNTLTTKLPQESLTKGKTTSLQHTLQACSDLTGYISAQVYTPYRASSTFGGSSAPNTNPAVEEFKREVRTLKGLVLNRRSFMPTIPRPGGSGTSPTMPVR